MSHTYKNDALDELMAEVARLEDRVEELESAGVAPDELWVRFRAEKNRLLDYIDELEHKNAELERVLENLRIGLTQGGSPAGAGDNEE